METDLKKIEPSFFSLFKWKHYPYLVLIFKMNKNGPDNPTCKIYLELKTQLPIRIFWLKQFMPSGQYSMSAKNEQIHGEAESEGRRYIWNQ